MQSAANSVKHNSGWKKKNIFKGNLVQILMEFLFLFIKIWFWEKDDQ